MTAIADIPVVDLEPLRHGSAAGAGVVASVERACRTSGFFLVTGHGVPAEVTARLRHLARAFFDLPDDEKALVAASGDEEGGLSFAPMASEALAATMDDTAPGDHRPGDYTPGDYTPGDYKESLNYGPRLPGGGWPDRPPGLREAFHHYSEAMETLAVLLRGVFSEAIGLERDHFEESFRHDLSALRVVNYPEQVTPPAEGQLRAGAHTDYGFMTILCSDASAGGLQVQSPDGRWVDVPSIDETYVVNIGDAFMRWTNDEWVSTPHRVVNPPAGERSGTRRQSIVYFVNPNAETVIECLDPFTGDGRRPSYDPITYRDHIDLKTGQAFGERHPRGW